MPAANTIRWNHLQLSVPAGWETIVKGPLHLIFEQNLAPVLEIRWRRPGKHGSHRLTESILKQFGEPSDINPHQGSPDVPDRVAGRYRITPLGGGGPPQVASLLLECRRCSTAILVGLHRGSPDFWIENAPLLDSLRCCPAHEQVTRWQIQDFYFAVPHGFELAACSFRFGISDLRFTKKGAVLRVCRLAPASVHLEQQGFTELFASFCPVPLDSPEVVDSCRLSYHWSAGAVERVWRRIRKKPPFGHASFSHFPDRDRILGVMIAAYRRSEVDWGRQLEDGYGIIQETEGAGSDA